jgi:hypothetical protein
MTLKLSSTDKARSYNIKKEREAGKPLKQSIAIGYAEQRKARRKGK